MTEAMNGFAHSDSTYIANILCNMSNGQYNCDRIPNFLTSMMSSSRANPSLSTTHLSSRDRTFIELQRVPSEGRIGTGVDCRLVTQGITTTASSSSTGVGCNAYTHCMATGFLNHDLTKNVFHPVGHPSSCEESPESVDSEPELDLTRGRACNNSRKHLVTGSGVQGDSPQHKYICRNRNEKLSPEDEQKRQIRRERNKLAAAKCRQRRVDHTQCLLEETDELEAKNGELEEEVQKLQQEKDHLEFLLQSHSPLCKIFTNNNNNNNVRIKMEQSRCVENSPPTTTHLTHTSVARVSAIGSMALSRPNSLPFASAARQQPVLVSCGHYSWSPLSLSTPSSGLFTYTSMDCLVDGSTGLTPLLTSPVPSCAGEAQRKEVECNTDFPMSKAIISI